MSEPDLELRAAIRSAAAKWTPSSCTNLKPELSTTEVNLSKVSTTNIYSQTCIQSLSGQALENDLDVKKVGDVCTIIAYFLDELVDDQFESCPASLSVKEKKKFESFKKVLTFVAKRFGENKAFYLYDARTRTGDVIATNELLVVLVYVFEGLQRPGDVFESGQGSGTVPNFSKLEDIGRKVSELSKKAFSGLEKRLSKTSNAEDLMLKLINTLECTIGIFENHPAYKLTPVVVRAVEMPQTDCEKQVETIKAAILEIQERLTLFQSEDVRNGWKVESYGKELGSDDIAVKGLAVQAREMEENFYLEARKLADDGTHTINAEWTTTCVSKFRYDIGSLQLQLFQRLRPKTEPCFATLLLKTDITAVGECQVNRSGPLIFWCRTCESEITWGGITQRRMAVSSEVPWKCIPVPYDREIPVHENYAVGHHLPAVKRSSGWKGKGQAKLYCGYCTKWQMGTPVDPQFVFEGIRELYKHLHAMHDVEEAGESCCIIL